MVSELTRRITLEEVQAAYAKFDVIPKRTNCACCALAIVVRAAGIPPFDPRSRFWTVKASTWLEDNLGTDYWNGFVTGFDHNFNTPCSNGRYNEGFDDGRLIAETLFKGMCYADTTS